MCVPRQTLTLALAVVVVVAAVLPELPSGCRVQSLCLMVRALGISVLTDAGAC